MCTPRWPSSSGSLSSIFAAARRRTLKLPTRLIAITRSNSARSCGPLRPAVFSAGPIPAQLTLIRSPASPAAASTAAWTWASSVTSVATNRAPSSSASAAPRSASMSAIVTFAPASSSARAVAAPRPDAPPATRAFVRSICMARTLTEARGAGLRGGAREHLVAAELRLEAHPARGAGLERERGLVLAGAGERPPLGLEDLGALPGRERDRSRAALRRRDRVRAGDLAGQAEGVGRLAVAARAQRERHVLGGEAADGDRPHGAGRLACPVGGGGDQRVAPDVAATRLGGGGGRRRRQLG